ncbi:MAG TPA: GNAT family N-acetyltransferase [Clostridia bacterium]|nr:GNAT family N-acetyltransferase [Clostridia bacterium]
MEFSLRGMRPDDIEGKAYVHWKSWQEAYTGLVDQSYLDALSVERSVERAHHWPDNTLVAEEDGKIVGFACYGVCRNEDLTDCGEVYAIYVLEAYQKHKIGYALMNACFERLTAYPKIAVWVLKGNEKAIRFYERYGFRFDGASAEITLCTPITELRMIFQRI